MSRSAPPEWINVYDVGESIHGKAKRVIPFAEADALVTNNLGVFRDHGKKLLLFPTPSIKNARGNSCKPGLALMGQYAESGWYSKKLWNGKDLAARAVIDGVQADGDDIPGVRGWSR